VSIRLLIVDPEVTERSPSLRSLLLVRPLLEQRGITYEFLSQKCELPGKNVWHRVPGGSLPLLPRLWVFLFYVHLIGRAKDKPDVPTVVYTTDGLCLWADILTFHYFNPAWLRIERMIPRQGWRDYATLLRSWQGWLQDMLQLRFGRWKFLNAVSPSILDEIRPWVRDRSCNLNVLPNVISAARFNKEDRLARRITARTTLGYGTEDKVFLFISQGHHRRKGFWLAVEALALVRKSGFADARFHVVGGFPKTLERLKKRLNQKFPGWQDWICFFGMVSKPEDHFAAADALLLPSYFEAFSLVEIEAAAMGLPLLLTPHHGSEMILKDGVNGLVLPFDAAGIAEILIQGIQAGFPASPQSGADRFTAKDFASLLKEQIQSCLAESNLDAIH